MIEVNTYRARRQACTATARRSLNAYRRGKCSQFEVRQLGANGFVGGLCGDLAKRFPTFPILAQWSGGYRV